MHYHKQTKTLRLDVLVVPKVVLFVLIVPDQTDKVQIQTKIKIIEIQTTITTDTTLIIKTIDTITVAINKTTDIITIAIHQTSNKTEITQINNHVGIITEQITCSGIVKHVLTAENWDICLAKVEHHDEIRTTDKKTQIRTKTIKTYEILIKTATQIPLSNKIL